MSIVKSSSKNHFGRGDVVTLGPQYAWVALNPVYTLHVQCDFQIPQKHPHQVKDVQQGRPHPQNDHFGGKLKYFFSIILCQNFIRYLAMKKDRHVKQAIFQVLEKMSCSFQLGTMFATTPGVEQDFFPMVNLTPQSCQVNNACMIYGG